MLLPLAYFFLNPYLAVLCQFQAWQRSIASRLNRPCLGQRKNTVGFRASERRGAYELRWPWLAERSAAECSPEDSTLGQPGSIRDPPSRPPDRVLQAAHPWDGAQHLEYLASWSHQVSSLRANFEVAQPITTQQNAELRTFTKNLLRTIVCIDLHVFIIDYYLFSLSIKGPVIIYERGGGKQHFPGKNSAAHSARERRISRPTRHCAIIFRRPLLKSTVKTPIFIVKQICVHVCANNPFLRIISKVLNT